MGLVTKEQIKGGLADLGLGPGDRVLVHASLKSFGYVEGGPDAVIDALIETVGDSGTVMFPTLSFSSIDENNPFFDVRNTPSDTGLISETARKRPDAIRSEHPFSSATAIGQDALYMTSDHLDTPCGPTSPYGRLVELGGYSLFIGTDFDRNSVFHVAEEIANPGYLVYKTIPNVRILTASGLEKKATVRRYNCYQTGIMRYLIKMKEVYMREGAVTTGYIGSALCYLVPARENVRIAVEILKKDPGFILSPPTVMK